MGISVFFSMIKAIKILNGIKYLEIMKVTFNMYRSSSIFYQLVRLEFWNDLKGTYFRAGDDLRNHLIFMVCIFGGFVHASRVLFKETHDFSSPMRAIQMVLGFSERILELWQLHYGFVQRFWIHGRLDFTHRQTYLISILILVAGTYFITDWFLIFCWWL